MAKIGIYGGTFNPIHHGHLHILRQFMEQLSLNRAILIPDRVPPHKPAHDMAPAEDRLAMCQLAVKDMEGVTVSDMEMKRQGKSYTADTLRELKIQFPEDELFLLMGEDMFLTVDHWYQPDVIFRCATLAGAPRQDGDTKKMEEHKLVLQSLGAKVCLCRIPFLPVSSTQVRHCCYVGESIGNLVPPAVETYIYEHHLYGV